MEERYFLVTTWCFCYIYSKASSSSFMFFLIFSISILRSHSASNTRLWRVLLDKIGIYISNKLSSIFSKWWSNLVCLNDTLWWLYSAYFAMDSSYYAWLQWQANANTFPSLLITVLINEDCCHAPSHKLRHIYCHAP